LTATEVGVVGVDRALEGADHVLVGAETGAMTIGDEAAMIPEVVDAVMILAIAAAAGVTMTGGDADASMGSEADSCWRALCIQDSVLLAGSKIWPCI